MIHSTSRALKRPAFIKPVLELAAHDACRAKQPARMTTIDPALHDRTASPFQVTASLLQPSRLRAYLLRAGEVTALVAFLSFCVMWVQWQASSRGFYNVSGDFVGFWTAGELALEGHAADAYREMPHFFKQLALHGDPSRLYLAFFYPPYFSAVVRRVCLARLFHGLVRVAYNNLRLLRRRDPRTAGEGLGPKLARLGSVSRLSGRDGEHRLRAKRIPEHGADGRSGRLARPAAGIGRRVSWVSRLQAAAWHHRAAGAGGSEAVEGLRVASATVLVLVAAATLAFGLDIWPPFFADMGVARHNWLEAPVPAYLQFLVTIFGAIRLHDGPLPLAYAAQAVVSVTAIFMLVRALVTRPPGLRVGQGGNRGNRSLHSVLLALHAGIRPAHPGRTDGLASGRGIARRLSPRRGYCAGSRLSGARFVQGHGV